jgi:hypothetical protein
MARLFGYKRLRRPIDWRGLAGQKNWVPTRSAYELAHCWQGFGGMPPEIAEALLCSGSTHLTGLSIELCLVEKPVFLDTNVGPSMTDLMAYGRNHAGEAVVIAVEGKADEPFGPPVCAWVRGDGARNLGRAPCCPSRLRRLNFLSQTLGIPIPADSKVRYQLFHRTASVILEARLHGAVAAVVIVHAFGPVCQENFADYSCFLRELGDSSPTVGAVSGPIWLGKGRDLPTYFLWWQQVAVNGHDSGDSR